jgi:hypothetical protein
VAVVVGRWSCRRRRSGPSCPAEMGAADHENKLSCNKKEMERIEREGSGAERTPQTEGGIDSTWDRPACTKHKPKSGDRITPGRSKSTPARAAGMLASFLLSLFEAVCAHACDVAAVLPFPF